MLKLEDLFDNWVPFDVKSSDELWAIPGKLPEMVGSQNVLGEGTEVQNEAWVRGPARFGKKCQVRHAAFVGANFYAEDGVVVGHACEVSNSYVGTGTHIAHLNFVGHSVIGRNCNIGAGALIANSKVHLRGEKKGAIIGDNVFIGIGVLIYPGTVIGKNCWVYPGAILRGVYGPNQIIKMKPELELAPIRKEN
ncbi:MAG: DapH/DapD/GlmU-related protein [bacterium]|nr:DapH/DapD/GlmU-related protein [bacterium]